MMEKRFEERDEKLLKFVQDYRSEERHTLRESLQHELLRQIVDGERECTAWATDPNNGDVFVCFSFTKDEDEKS